MHCGSRANFCFVFCLISEAYGAVDENKYLHWRLYRSKLIAELEDSMPHVIKEYFFPSAVEVVRDFIVVGVSALCIDLELTAGNRGL